MSTDPGQGANDIATPPSDLAFLDEFNALEPGFFDEYSSFCPPDEPSANNSVAAFDSGDMALAQSDIHLTDTTNIVSYGVPIPPDLCGSLDPATFPAPDLFASAPVTILHPQEHTFNLPVDASHYEGAPFAPLVTQTQFLGPADRMPTFHYGPPSLSHPSTSPLVNDWAADQAFDSSFPPEAHDASQSTQSHATVAFETPLALFEGPCPLTTPVHLSPPEGSAPFPIPTREMEVLSAPQAVHPRQSGAVSLRRIAPKKVPPNSSPLPVLGPSPPPSVRIAAKQDSLKRQRSPSFHENSSFSCFPAALNNGAPGKSKKRASGLTYSKHTCLRCKVNKEKCSGTFPCMKCLEVWDRTPRKTALHFKACFDSDLRNLNGFFTLWEVVVNSTPDAESAMVTSLSKIEDHTGHLFQSVQAASGLMESMVMNTMVDAGLAQFIRSEPTNKGGPRILPQRPAFSQTCNVHSLPTEWTLAVMHLQPEMMASLIGVSELELWSLRLLWSVKVFRSLADSIGKIKLSPETMDKETRNRLMEALVLLERVASSSFGSSLETTLNFLHHQFEVDFARQEVIAIKAFSAALKRYRESIRPYMEQGDHLREYVRHWIGKLYPDGGGHFILNWHFSVFRVEVLARLDMSQEPTTAPHPIDQAIKFLSEMKARTSAIDAMKWEKQNRSMGDLESWMAYMDKLGTLEQSMAAAEQADSTNH